MAVLPSQHQQQDSPLSRAMAAMMSGAAPRQRMPGPPPPQQQGMPPVAGSSLLPPNPGAAMATGGGAVTDFMPDFNDALTMFLGASPGISIGSGVRTVAEQGQLFETKVGAVMAANPGMSRAAAEEIADNDVARPGQSNHNRGMAADLHYPDDASRAWAAANAANYNLFFPMGHEPWHIELRR